MRPPPIFFFLLGLCVLSVYCGTKSDVIKFTKQFAELTSTVANGKDVLKSFATSTRMLTKLLRLSTPVGAFLATAGDMIYSPDPDEQEAIKLLHTDMINYMEKMSSNQHRVDKSLKKIEETLDFIFFYTTFERPLGRLEHGYTRLTNPRMNRTATRSEFIERCAKYSVSDLLDEIKKLYVLHCRMPTSRSTDQYVEALSVFRKAEKRLNEPEEHFQRKYVEMKNQFIFQIMHANTTEAVTLLTLVRTAPFSTTEELASLIKNNTHPTTGWCLFESLQLSYNSQRAEMRAGIKMLNYYLVLMNTLGAFCVNLINQHDPAQIQEEIEIMVGELNAIQNYTTTWMTKFEESVWPNVGRESTIKLIENRTKITTERLNSTAREIDHLFDRVGSDHYSYQIVVHHTPPRNNWCTLPRYAKNYVDALNINGVNVHVFRHKEGHIKRANKTSEWIIPNRSRIEAELERTYRTPNACSMLYALEQKFMFLDNHLYRHALLIRKEGITDKQAEINTGEVIRKVNGYAAGDKVYYMYQSLLFPSIQWRLFLLL